jgi:GNAT superfamily N-acetyltransferase
MKTFSEFLAEGSTEPKSDAHKTITKNWERKHKGMTARFKEKEDNIHLGDVWLPPSARSKGTGGRFVKGLSNYARKKGKSISLRADPEKGKEDKLHNFYTRAGFERSGSSNKYTKKPGPT